MTTASSPTIEARGSAGGAAVLELAAVSRVHGRGATAVHALSEVSLAVAPGEMVAVMGPSGSGKSLAGGLDRPEAGSVVVVTADAFTWLRTSRERFDVVVADFPDPDDAATAKVYSQEFYDGLRRRALAPGSSCRPAAVLRP